MGARKSIELKTGQNPKNPKQNDVVKAQKRALERKIATQTNVNQKEDKRYVTTKKRPLINKFKKVTNTTRVTAWIFLYGYGIINLTTK